MNLGTDPEGLPDFHRDLEARLAGSPFVAGEVFSVADITAIVVPDFVAARLELTIPQDRSAVRRWHAGIAARLSAAA